MMGTNMTEEIKDSLTGMTAMHLNLLMNGRKHAVLAIADSQQAGSHTLSWAI